MCSGRRFAAISPPCVVQGIYPGVPLPPIRTSPSLPVRILVQLSQNADAGVASNRRVRRRCLDRRPHRTPHTVASAGQNAAGAVEVDTGRLDWLLLSCCVTSLGSGTIAGAEG